MGQRPQTVWATVVNGRPKREGNGKCGNANKGGTAPDATEQYDGEEQSCSNSPKTLVCYGNSRSCRRHSVSVAPFTSVARPVFWPTSILLWDNASKPFGQLWSTENQNGKPGKRAS